MWLCKHCLMGDDAMGLVDFVKLFLLINWVESDNRQSKQLNMPVLSETSVFVCFSCKSDFGTHQPSNREDRVRHGQAIKF